MALKLRRRRNAALALLLLMATIWGSTTTIAKVALDDSVPPLGYAFWQSGIAAALLVLIGLWRRRLPPVTPRHLLYYAMMGIGGQSLPDANFFVALQHLPAGLMTVVLTSSPLFTYGLSMWLGNEAFGIRRFFGILLGFVGAAFLVVPQLLLPQFPLAGDGQGPSAFWVLFAFATPLLYSLTNVFGQRRLPQGVDDLALATGLAVFGASGAVAGMLATDGFYWPWPLDWSGAWAVILDGVLSALAFVCYFRVVRLAGAVYLSQVAYLIVMVGMVLSLTVLGERHGIWVWAGIATIVAGVALVNTTPRKKKEAATS